MKRALFTVAGGCMMLLVCCIVCIHSPNVTRGHDLPNEHLRLVFVGDTSFGENYQQQIEKRGGENILKTRGYEYSLKHFASFLKQADLVIANLETPVTDLPSSPLEGKKSYIHWSNPNRTPKTLAQHNILAVSLANNHALDYGIMGLQQSIDALEKHGIQWFGAGWDEASAMRPLHFNYLLAEKPLQFVIAAGFRYYQSYDERYGFYAAGAKGGTNGWTVDRAAEQLRKIRQTHLNALVVAYPHFGKNYAWKTGRQTKLARTLIDGGADLVIGHGAHMLQEIELYRDRWIIYNLGNFVFNSPGRYGKMKGHPFSFIARLDIEEKQDSPAFSLRLYPIFSDNLISNYQPYFVSDQQFHKVLDLLMKRSINPESLHKKMKTGEDEFGRYLLLNVASYK